MKLSLYLKRRRCHVVAKILSYAKYKGRSEWYVYRSWVRAKFRSVGNIDPNNKEIQELIEFILSDIGPNEKKCELIESIIIGLGILKDREFTRKEGKLIESISENLNFLLNNKGIIFIDLNR